MYTLLLRGSNMVGTSMAFSPLCDRILFVLWRSGFDSRTQRADGTSQFFISIFDSTVNSDSWWNLMKRFFVCWSTYFPLKSAQPPQALIHLLLFPLTITSPYRSLRLINHNPLGVFRHKLYPWPRANFTLSHQSKMILHRVSFSLFPPDSHHFHYSLTTCFVFCFFCNPQDKNKQQHNSLLDICLLATKRWFVLDTECR